MSSFKSNSLRVDAVGAMREGYRLVFVYLVVGVLYILLSDRIVSQISNDPRTIIQLQLIKGWAFIFATAVLLTVLVNRLILKRVARECELRSLLQGIPDQIWVKDTEGRYVAGNESFFEMLGRSEDEVLGRRLHEISDDDQAKRISELDKTILETKLPVHWVETKLADSGKLKYYSISKVPIYDHKGGTIGILGVSRDITEHKVMEDTLRHSEQQFRAVVESSPNGIVMVDEAGKVTLVNKEVERAFGYTRRELLSKPFEALVPNFVPSASERDPMSTAKLYGVRKDGSEFPVLVGLTPVNTGDGSFILATVSDLSEQARAEEKIRKLALFDDLTSLPNRNLFVQNLEVSLTQAVSAQSKLSVLALNLDRFKLINDSLGHEAGDHLLREVAARLRETLREKDFLARLGADDFVIIAPSTGDLGALANKILEVVSRPIIVQGKEQQVTACIGISSYPHDAAEASELHRLAELALGYAKEKGSGTFEFYTELLEHRTARRLAIEAGLRGALDRGEFTLHFQPIVDIREGRATGAEALLRWKHADLGNVPPDQFIPVAEGSGAITEIGAWVLREACAAAGRWIASGKELGYISVNLSPSQLHDPQLQSAIIDSLATSGLRPDQLQLEITEGMVMEDPVASINQLKELKGLGISIAMDDFGTGYSSLAYLKRLPIDRIKIDRSFVLDIPQDADSTAIVRSIIGLAKGLRRTLVAEGVETAEQVAFLQNLGCESVQGYFFSRPVPESDFLELCGKQFDLALFEKAA